MEATPEPYGPPTEAEDFMNRLEVTLARKAPWVSPEERLLFAAMDFPTLAHTEYVCTTVHEDGGWTCQFCAGGLSACAVCGSFEGATTDHCPGAEMAWGQREAVYAGTLNYRDGAWRAECCRVMRPVYDREAYMREAGYVPDTHGGWIHVEETPSFTPTYPGCATCDGGGCGDCA